VSHDDEQPPSVASRLWKRLRADGMRAAADILASLTEALDQEGETADRILFWSARRPPSRYVRVDIAADDRALVAVALRAGAVAMSYMGWADCRICGQPLGTSDLETHGLVFPEKAEHYVLEHDVWTPGCDELLRRIRGGK
jgi:hypothetical protein